MLHNRIKSLDHVLIHKIELVLPGELLGLRHKLFHLLKLLSHLIYFTVELDVDQRTVVEVDSLLPPLKQSVDIKIVLKPYSLDPVHIVFLFENVIKLFVLQHLVVIKIVVLELLLQLDLILQELGSVFRNLQGLLEPRQVFLIRKQHLLENFHAVDDEAQVEVAIAQVSVVVFRFELEVALAQLVVDKAAHLL